MPSIFPYAISRQIISSTVFFRSKIGHISQPNAPTRRELCINRGGLHDDDNNQTRHHQRQRHKRDNQHSPAARRELAPQNPPLACVVPVVAQEQHQDADRQERRSKRLPDMAQSLEVIALVPPSTRDAGVEPEQLRDCDSYGGKGQRGTEPREEGPLWSSRQRLL
jgi:hypothetical protein